MKKIIIFAIVIYVFGILSFQIYSDDKELFLGKNAGSSIVKPNVMFLLDNSSSMRSIVYYPKRGVDGKIGTADDGYNSKKSYSEGKMYNYKELRIKYFTEYIAYLQSSQDTIINKTSGSASTYWVKKIKKDSISFYSSDKKKYVTGQWIFDTNNQVGGKIEKQESSFDIMRQEWLITLTLTDIGPTGKTFKKGNVNLQMFLEANIKEVAGERIKLDELGYSLYKEGWWLVDKFTGAKAQINTKDGGGWVTLKNREGNFEKDKYVAGTEVASGLELKVIGIYGTNVGREVATYSTRYINWIFYHSTDAQRASITFFTKYGTFDTDIKPADTPAFQNNSCGQVDGSNNLLKKKVWTRIQVLREVACQVAENSYKKVRMGMFMFDDRKQTGEANGGEWVADLEDLDKTGGLKAYKNKAYAIKAKSFTPLAESLADVWRYFKPGGTSKVYKTAWKTKDYQPILYTLDSNKPDIKTSPIELYCQKNYVILITDGSPTEDNFEDDSTWDGSIFTDDKSSITRKMDYRPKGWAGWKPEHGWGDKDNLTSEKRDNVDDVAYFLNHQDMFPDSKYPTWKGEQNISIFTVGFAIDNTLLKDTAKNGKGDYYTASNSKEVVAAFDNIITTILLRNFAFTSITAPKKSAKVANKDLNVSFVGYFYPSTANSVWEGHLTSHLILQKWGFDADDSDVIDTDEQIYKDQATCNTASATASPNNPKPCEKFIELSTTVRWDAASKMKTMKDNNIARKLYYYDGQTDTSGNIDLTKNVKLLSSLDAEKPSMLRTLLDEPALPTPTDVEITKKAKVVKDSLAEHKFAGIFHSDLAFLGKALAGKKYIKNINPEECVKDGTKSTCYQAYYDKYKARKEYIYVGTNDGILHMIDANIEVGGKEIWGFVPDEVLPAVKRMTTTSKHEYTVDGRIKIEDIFYRKGTVKEWKSILVFGLRRGGNAFYALDVSSANSTKPQLLWKFKDSFYSGQSFSKPKIVQMRIENKNDPTVIDKKWVAIFTGGFAFNNENINDSKGKAIFIVDASTGKLIWMLGYNKSGASDDTKTKYIDTINTIVDPGEGIKNPRKHLTSSDLMNFSIPTSITVIDKNNDGYSDKIYFGNKGGHLFKIDMRNPDPKSWRSYNLYERKDSNYANNTSSEISSIVGEVVVIKTAIDSKKYVGYNVISYNADKSKYASGVIEEINATGDRLTIKRTSKDLFDTSQKLYIKDWDPIYLAPALYFDSCSKLWVSFGTGDRDRPRTNPNSGRLVAFLDNGLYNLNTSNFEDLSKGVFKPDLEDKSYESFEEQVGATKSGFIFKFPGLREKLFDPAPLVLPDLSFVPHIVFNTYQPPKKTVASTNPCKAPDEGSMQIYDIEVGNCGLEEYKIKIKKTDGRIAGGGMINGTEHITYLGTGSVGSVHGGGGGTQTKKDKINITGKIVFWKEKKR